MALNNFRLQLVFRIAIIAVCTTGAVASLFYTHWIVTPALLFGLMILGICELIYFIEKTNRDFTSFLLSIKNADFSGHTISDKRGRTFTEFREALNIITAAFQKVRTDKEANYIFLQTVVSDLSTALLSFDECGEVKLINDAAKTLLHIPHLKNINSLNQSAPRLADYLNKLKSTENSMLEIKIGDEQLKLSGRAIDFNIQGIEHKLVSIQDIRTEIDATETEAWEQLLHVLTHEIMNSITPISSLSSTLKKKTDELLKQHKDDEDIMNDLSGGLNVIARRSEGLINFVNHYKTLINLPAPMFKLVSVEALFNNVLLLTNDRMTKQQLSVRCNYSELPMYLKADAGQVEQVLINLLNNAADALENIEQPSIILTASSSADKTIIQLIDNGKGFDTEVADKLFVPFFTTKNNGSGIGLSLSRQIMRRHGGSISIRSSKGEQTICRLEFPL